MNSADLLLTVSQVAIGLAGFSAIVVTLNPRPIREWNVTDRLSLRVLVQVSFVVLFFSLFPFVLAITLSPADVWFYSLWVYGVLHLVDVISFNVSMTPETHNVFRVTARIGIFVALAQIVINVIGDVGLRETAYIVTLVWHLYVVFMGFTLLLYQLRKSA
jgi:hypothetical protein